MEAIGSLAERKPKSESIGHGGRLLIATPKIELDLTRWEVEEDPSAYRLPEAGWINAENPLDRPDLIVSELGQKRGLRRVPVFCCTDEGAETTPQKFFHATSLLEAPVVETPLPVEIQNSVWINRIVWL
jgi:hypothetical protein